jgi:hypothetical protein
VAAILKRFARNRETSIARFTKRGGVTNPSNHESGWMDQPLPPELPPLLTSHPNMLIVASEQSLEAAVRALTPYLRQPVTVWASTSETSLPSSGAVIIRMVGSLTLRDQKALFSWLDGRGKDTQVVSLTPFQLFPLVADGRFLADLYYRINTVQFAADENVGKGQLLAL